MQAERFLFSPIYWIMWLALAAVYIIGLFVPLFDTDPAHHALIALHMVETNDWVSLIDRGRDYLDKPHLLFWLSALSFKTFGINTFAYKFPSMLASIVGFYSAFRLGKLLYSEAVGRLAALIYASCYAQFLSNQDVRMDALLTACMVFSVWMLLSFVREGKRKYALGSALGLALGFATKGGIGLAMPLMALGFQLLYERNWKAIFQWSWVFIGFSFLVFISPILYCYYLQFDLHPEKVIRGMTGLSGIKFILLGQSVERFQGEAWGSSGSNDYFFFFHTLLWSCLPWAFLIYWSLFRAIRHFKAQKEVLTLGIIVSMMLILSMAQYKLPHYLNLLYPYLAIQLSGQLLSSSEKTIRSLMIVQAVVVTLMMGITIYLNTVITPIPGLLNQLVALAVAGFLLYLSIRQSPVFVRLVAVSLAGISITFMSLSANAYPYLFRYDSGYEFARTADPAVRDSFSFYRIYSYTFDFYTKKLHPPLPEGKIPETRWILTDSTGLAELRQAGVKMAQIRSNPHFHLSTLNGEFLNPATRLQACERRYLIERY
ncbi:ArnT family glycosyltransferase [Siphonobacter sp.]|uniref:ArnT family glycosyltransferase n=1 Tax=Siphonobacter sp. TaxID=1869184 RepID=UPI003B3B50BA